MLPTFTVVTPANVTVFVPTVVAVFEIDVKASPPGATVTVTSTGEPAGGALSSVTATDTCRSRPIEMAAPELMRTSGASTVALTVWNVVAIENGAGAVYASVVTPEVSGSNRVVCWNPPPPGN